MDSALRLSLLLCVCGVASLAAAARASEQLLDMQKLQWLTPVEGPTCELSERSALVRVPQAPDGYNHWVDGVAHAPTLQIEAPDGDWDLSAKIDLIDFTPNSNFHVGLVVGFADAYVIIFGPFQGPAVWKEGKWPELWLEGTGMPAMSRLKIDARALELQIRKRQNEYACYYRKGEGAKWERCGEYLGVFPPRFIGVIGKTFSNGPGIAFSARDLRVEPASSEHSTARIWVDAKSSGGRIDRNIYGHFIEHLGRCIYGGIWAEMLYNRKFTGGVDSQGVIESWSAFGEDAKYSRDNIEFYTSCQSQRIELAPGKEAGIGKRDANLAIKPQRYVVRAVLKQKELSGGVTVALRQGKHIYASALIPEVGEDWSEYTVQLDVLESDPNAEFSVTAVGPGTLWIGCLSMMPADNVEGMRRDVLEAIKRIKPPLVRWPGGNMVSGYHWEDGIGPRDKRMPRWERAWNAWEWNDFGTDEYIRFCRLVGTEPYICVNAGEGQADEAARWVEYCNGSPDTPYGRLRALNGHPEPYNVKYWGIGNEMYGDWQLGHLDATKYALKSIEFACAMKAVDPSIVLVGVGVDNDSFGNWNSTVAQIAGSYYDYLSVHYYKGPRAKDPKELTYLNLICASLEIEKMLAATADVVEHNSPKKLPLAFDEWNIWLPHGLDSSMYALRDGLFAAGVFHTLHRLCDRVKMANLAQLVNVLGAIQTSMTEVVETPIYKAFELYSNLFEANRLEVNAECNLFDTPAGRMPVLDASAAISEDGTKLVLAVINRDPVSDHLAELKISGFKPRACAQVAVLNGPSAFAVNNFGKPEQVTIERKSVDVDFSKPYSFPAHSVTIMVMKAQ
ncbi:MAG: alpha-L-arabinofuranosidase C-terminal domain-containing protein [Armatimonadota bacterium]|nr:alpha-L-arabinofuranosidase C-terminal domain-containing protein [Armatimonadota bacterium]